VLNVVFPLLRVPVPRVVVPSLKVTVPVAADGETVAVNVTDDAYVDGVPDVATVVVVFVLAAASSATDIKRATRTRTLTKPFFTDGLYLYSYSFNFMPER
jgi:hypothetical protein